VAPEETRKKPVAQVNTRYRKDTKKQQMQWSRRGAHLLLQVRTEVLNEDLEESFRAWYPGFRPRPQKAAA